MKNRQNIPGNARRLKGAITRLEQQPYNFAPGRRLPRAPAPLAFGLCQLGSSLGPATGTWPSLTATSQASIDVYVDVNGTLTQLGTFTVYNWLNVTWSASKTTLVAQWPCGRWFVIDQVC